MEPIIFNIQRMSLHDGPGVRTTVFFKGCSLRCRWCHNPESIHAGPELEWKPYQCIGCGECAAVCCSHAKVSGRNGILYEREKCRGCGACADVCVSGASVIAGVKMSLEEILKEVQKDEKMYRITGGGVTCSGGEPLLQPEAVAGLFHLLKQKGIHTAVDTAGNVPWEAFEKVMDDTDLFLFDIKHLDKEMHKKYTGAYNLRILENFQKLTECKEVIVRIPVIKGINDNCLKEIADYLKDKKNIRLVELLPYHALGGTKYESLGKKEEKFAPPDKEVLEDAVRYLGQCKIPAVSR